MKYGELVEVLRECNDCRCEEHCPYHEERNNPLKCMTKIVGDAADAIEKLLGVIQQQRETINATAYLPLYPKPKKWISVTERLPELRMWESGSLASSNVLFVTEDKTIHIGYVMEDFNIGDNGCLKIDRWFMLGGYRIENVTHWMPLPEPPKEET